MSAFHEKDYVGLVVLEKPLFPQSVRLFLKLENWLMKGLWEDKSFYLFISSSIAK